MQPELATEPGIMGALSTLAHRLHLPTTLVKFFIVGGAGFVVAEAGLFLFYHGTSPLDSALDGLIFAQNTPVDLGVRSLGDLRFLISTSLAIEIAIVAQFYLHEIWTFRHRSRDGTLIQRLVRFNLSAGVGAVINVGIAYVLKQVANMPPFLALAGGVFVGSAWNWTLNSLVIWPRQEEA